MCLFITTEIEKHQGEGLIVVKASVNVLCNRLIVLKIPCIYVMNVIVEKAFKSIVDHLTPQTVCSKILHMCPSGVDEMLQILNVMERGMHTFEKGYSVVFAQTTIIPPADIVGPNGLMDITFTQTYISTTFAHAAT